MNTERLNAAVDAPERYELEEEPFPHPLPIRPDLFRLFGAGLVVLAGPEPETQEPGTPNFDVWLHVGENGRVTVGTGKAEVGQNIRTSLAQAVADELPLPPDAIRVVLADTDLTPFDIGTFGSRTTPLMVPQVRRAAAAARETLLGLAAERWQVDQALLRAGRGKIVRASVQASLDYGQLLQGRRIVRTVGPDVATRPAAQWTVAGTSPPKVDGRAFVTGRHHYTSDLATEGMLHGKVLRPPVWGATLKDVDVSRARQWPGVTVVQDSAFVGVAAPTVADAEGALAATTAEWDVPTKGGDQDLVALLRPIPTPLSIPSESGVTHSLKATYTLAYIAHVPLEPRAALAVWSGDRLTVWTGTQRPFGVREELAVALGLPEDRVRVVVPDTGSGYGGKHTGEAAVEAARLARAAGRPVKIVWTREEEFTAGYLRPAGVIDVCAAARGDATISHWEFHNYNSGGAGLRSPYHVPQQHVEFHETSSPLRQGSYRALAATGNHFARECHMDDLARACRMDPLAFRLRNLQDDRLRAVLEAAAERFGWSGRRAVPGHGFGIAGGTEKGSYVANCVEVAVEGPRNAVRITRIVAAFECGAIVNPMHLESQVEGATVMGIGGALFEAIRFAGGRILNPRLSEYRVPRFGDISEIDVVLLDRKDLPSAGAGETPIIAVAGAIGNAIFDATGIRLRALPLAPDGMIP
ncbi:MAG: xanthine dehydrogenase family protein molybdopterin-binding subunit [Armatimonadetes bacterium]|nr:xanthine dehydrogenase family protein molybdopterin-binding subunit [Armatimonadota bacterium]